MTCQSCREKKIKQWIDRGKSREWAEKHYDSVIAPRIREPKQRSRLHQRIMFLTKLNITATVRWTLRRRSLTLIGRHIGSGRNPDYTLPCNACKLVGDCNEWGECVNVANCRAYFVCNPSCPTPLPNSTCTPNTCACTKGGCTCARISGEWVCRESGAYPPPSCGAPVGQCDCNCTPPYVWDEDLDQCVLAAPKIKAGLHPSKPLAIILNE